MKRAMAYGGLLFILGLALLSPRALAEEDLFLYQYAQNRELVHFVREAAEKVSLEGEAALSEFRAPGSRWFSGVRYLFILDLDGTCLLNLQFPFLEGKNILEKTDIHGRKINHWIVETAKDPEKPWGWVHYLAPAPKSFFPAWKSAYIMGVKTPSGKTLAIGSGVYGTRMEKVFTEELVDSAAGLVAKKGRQAFPELLDNSGKYMFAGESVYVFKMDGKAVAEWDFKWHPGRNILDFTDSRGKPVMRGILRQLQKKDTARAVHLWPRPGHTKPSKQYVYARKVQGGGETFVVASHIYMENPIWLKY